MGQKTNAELNENMVRRGDKIFNYSAAASVGILVFNWMLEVKILVSRSKNIESEEFKLFLEYMALATVIISSVAFALMILGFMMSQITRNRGEQDIGH